MSSPSIAIILRKEANKQGLHPLALRITIDRKTTYKYLGYRLLPKQWDTKKQRVKSSYPNSARLNNVLSKALIKAEDDILNQVASKERVTVETVKAKRKRNKKALNFHEYALSYLEQMRESGKYNQYMADKSRVHRLKEFNKGIDLAFDEISVGLLNAFKAWLLGKKKISERTAVNHLVVVRTIYNRAIKEKLVSREHYPFGSGGITIRFPDSAKVGLSRVEVEKLENLDLSYDAALDHARNVWLFSFYLAGMRVSDVLRLKWSDIQDHRIHYVMGKNLKEWFTWTPSESN